MSYARLLSDRCDIFHVKTETAPGSYGVPSESKGKLYKYDVVPDLFDVPCYFVKSNTSSYSQNEPNRTISEQWLVHFLPSVDLRLNDKVTMNGVEYRLQAPKKIKNHHWEVIAIREGSI